MFNFLKNLFKKKEAVSVQFTMTDFKKIYKNYTKSQLIREMALTKVILQSICDAHKIDTKNLKDYLPK